MKRLLSAVVLLSLAGCGSSAPSQQHLRQQLLSTAAQESNALGGGYDYACRFITSQFIQCTGSGGGTIWPYHVTADGKLERVP